eukprot:366553-Chlamydomonas_euryale.AAC.4
MACGITHAALPQFALLWLALPCCSLPCYGCLALLRLALPCCGLPCTAAACLALLRLALPCCDLPCPAAACPALLRLACRPPAAACPPAACPAVACPAVPSVLLGNHFLPPLCRPSLNPAGSYTFVGGLPDAATDAKLTCRRRGRARPSAGVLRPRACWGSRRSSRAEPDGPSPPPPCPPPSSSRSPPPSFPPRAGAQSEAPAPRHRARKLQDPPSERELRLGR